MRKIRSLDISSTKLDGNGVHDFHWPLSWREHAAFRDHLLSGYATIARRLTGKDDEDGELLAILAMEFLQEVMRGWYVAVLIERFSRRGEQISASWLRSSNIEDVAAWSPRRDRIEFLRGRFPGSTWRALLRPLYGLTQNDNLSWRWPQTVDFKTRIIATNACALTRLHARNAGESPVLVSLRYWFGASSDAVPVDLTAYSLSEETITAVINAVTEAALKNDDVLPPALVSHLTTWLNEAAQICRWHLRWLVAHPNRLPAQLWTGSGGYIFRRILHTAVRQAGGHSTSHDHGSGLGLFDAYDMNFTEFVTPNLFTTFSPTQAAGYRTQQRAAFQMRPVWPKIEAVPTTKRSNPVVQRPPVNRTRPRSILIVANQYRGEKMTLTPIEFDLVACDWQARLFHHLTELGYEVRLRAHPDSAYPPPADFQTKLQVKLATGPFADVLKDADAVILDYLHTSALREVLLSGKPVMTFEFGHCPPNAVAAGILARRINFIPGWYDNANRAQTDWRKLPEAIDVACEMSADEGFIELFES